MWSNRLMDFKHMFPSHVLRVFSTKLPEIQSQWMRIRTNILPGNFIRWYELHLFNGKLKTEDPSSHEFTVVKDRGKIEWFHYIFTFGFQ
jgi:hypothetical protein